MARTWSECVASSRKALARYDRAQFQIGIDAAEAIPPGTQGVDKGITKQIKQYAAEVGVEPKTLERWRAVAIFYRAVMEFPPTGGFSKVNYSAYRELQERFDHPEDAYAVLRLAAEGETSPDSGRWTRDAIKALLRRLNKTETQTNAETKPRGRQTTPYDTLREQAAQAAKNAAARSTTTTTTPETKTQKDGSQTSEVPVERIVADLQRVLDDLASIEQLIEQALRLIQEAAAVAAQPVPLAVIKPHGSALRFVICS
jgi:hypothetical protein